MKRIIQVAVLFCLGMAAGALSAQTTTYTGVIKDLSNNPVTSGQVTFTLTPRTDSTVPGVGRFVPATIPCSINGDGTLSGYVGGVISGACSVQQNTSISPGGTSYRICIQPNFATPGSCFFDYATTTSKDISTIAPTLSTGPINYGGVPGPIGLQGPQGIPGSTTATGAGGGFLIPGLTAPQGDMSHATQLTSFGTSLSVGFGLTPNTLGFVYRLAAGKNWTLFNKAVSGSMIGDQATFYMAETPATGNNYMIELAYNDMRINGTDFTKAAEYQGALYAAASHLAIPITQFIPASQAQVVSGQPGCLYTGTWSNQTLYGIVGRFSGANGSTITCVTTPGSTVFLYGLTQVGNTSSQFTVTIDGVAATCNTQTNSCLNGTTFTEFGTTTTANGATFQPHAWRFAGLSNNYHTVVVTNSASGTLGLHIQGVAAAGTALGGLNMPQVMVLQSPRMSVAGYAAGFSGSDAAVAMYNERIRQVVSDLVQDGLQVQTTDLSSTAVLDPYNLALMQSDNVHFSAAGAQQIANAIASEFANMAFARDHGQILRGISSYGGSLYAGGVPKGTLPGEMGASYDAGSGHFSVGLDHCGFDRVSLQVYQMGGNCPAGITFFQFGGVTSAFPAFKLNASGVSISARAADDSANIAFFAKSVGLDADPTSALQAATKQYVDATTPLTGTTGTITGTSLTAACDSGTASVTGAVVGKPVQVGSTTGADVGGAFYLRASVTATNTVSVYVCGTGTPASLAYNVSVAR